MIKKIINIAGYAAGWLAWPLLYMVLNNSVRSRVIIEHDGKYLLVRPITNLSYAFPGGGVKKGEKLADCAAREIQEELSLSVDAKHLIYLGEQQQSYHGIRFTNKLYGIQLAEKPTVKLNSYELIDYQWVDTRSISNTSLAKNADKHIQLWQKHA